MAEPQCTQAVVGQAMPLLGGTREPRLLPLSEHQRRGLVLVQPKLQIVRSLCSGVLVHERAVITAKHCRLGDEMLIRFGDAGDPSAPVFQAAAWREHPTLDLLLLWLADSEPLQQVAREHYRLLAGSLDEAFLGRCVQLCGYGVTHDGSGGALMFAGGTIEELSEESIVVHGNDGAGACKGDSGSPVLSVDELGRNVVLGILSHGSGQCDGRDSYLRVDVARDWIHEQLGALEGEAPATP